jgi:ABC-type branched-subunit amino acid transport system ATPase component
MSIPQPRGYYAVEEYLGLERAAEERHEYLDELIYAMAGESLEPNTICANGAPQQVLADPRVIEIYLGSEVV